MKYVFSLMVSILLSVSTIYADSLRCAYDIAGTGDSKVVVTRKCGPPHWREPLGSVTRGAFQTGRELTAPGQYPKGMPVPGHEKAGVYAEQTLILEKWYYDCGSDAFIHALTFEGDVVTRIESTSQRGSGNYSCQP